MDGLWRQVDAYCERLDPGFWAEPLNAVSNAAFLIGALAAWLIAVREGRDRDWAVRALVGVLTLIGIGSFLFHTFATGWAAAADVIPIMAFIALYLYLALKRYFRLPVWAALGLTVGWMAVSPALGAWLRPAIGDLNGSIMYVPTWLLIVGVAVILAIRAHPAWRGVAAGGALLAVSLTFRTLDDQTGAICAAFPAGLHWGWHLFNGTLLAVFIVTLVRHGAPGGGRVARGAAAG